MTIPTAAGKKRGNKDGGHASAVAAPAAVTDAWAAAPDEPSSAGEPAAPAQPLGYSDPVVEGEAVELPPVEPAAPVYEPPVPLTLQGTAPAAEQPISAVESAGTAAGSPVTSLGDAGEAFASGHAAAPGPSWQEPLMELADERPELVVGAAFAGGILAAMILRRLGS